jgi:hypothetical protein
MKVTLSQDIFGICIILSEGNLNMRLGEIIKLVEGFQEKNDRHFGITRDDFRSLLIRLIWEKYPGSIFNRSRHLDNVTLEEVALEMLSYEDVYCNDEGEYWCSPDGRWKLGEYHIRELFDGNVDAYLDKLSVKRMLVEFFQDLQRGDVNTSEISELMARAKITRDILYVCSRPGDSS